MSKQIDKIIEAIAEGLLHPSMKAKLDSLEEQKARLEVELANAEPEQPVLLHPALSQMYKKKVADLTEVLNDPETKAEATTIIRSMLSEIRLTPNNDALEIELVGELAGLLSLGQKETASKGYASCRSVTLVAGARFSRGLSDKISDKNLPLTPAQAALVAGARRKRSLLHAAWDITAVKRPKTEIDYDALLGFPSPSLH